jgi:hypothetical protein
MTAPKDGQVHRAIRRFRLGSGPLKRRSDRLQAMGRVVVVLSFFVAPPIAVAVGNSATAHLQSVATAEAADRTLVRAVLQEDAPAPRTTGEGSDSLIRVTAQAEWSLPGGLPQEGPVRTRPGTPAGSVVPVWVDSDGNVTRAPLDRADIPTSAAAVAALPLIGVPAATWTLYAFLCIALDNHRARRWAEDWAEVEPKWNSRSL